MYTIQFGLTPTPRGATWKEALELRIWGWGGVHFGGLGVYILGGLRVHPRVSSCPVLSRVCVNNQFLRTFYLIISEF